jgi:hypothetical protein
MTMDSNDQVEACQFNDGSNFVPMDPVKALAELRRRSNDLFHLALVLKGSRTLAEWSDAQDSMAAIMERLGDLFDQVDPIHVGFVDGRRTCAPTGDLIARGKRLENAFHRFCGGGTHAYVGCDCSDCLEVRDFRLEAVE